MAFDLKRALSTLAPTLATMLGGPFAGTAVAALEQAFNLAPGSGQDGITKVLQTGTMSPDTIAAVRAADQKHAEIIAQQGIDLAKLNADHEAAMATVDAGDRDSARKRQIAVRDATPGRLAFVIIGGFFGVSVAQLWALMGHAQEVAAIPAQGWLLIGNISGYLAQEAKSAAAYYFGTTAGSDKKTDLLAQAPPVVK